MEKRKRRDGQLTVISGEYWSVCLHIPQKSRTFAPFFMAGSFLIISTSKALLRIAAEHIVYLEADGNYTTIFVVGKHSECVTCQLGQVEDLLVAQLKEDSNRFVRIGRSLNINTDYIYSIDVTHQKLVLLDSQLCRYELAISKDILKNLKSAVEEEFGL